jgi:glycosyltransferase involved in cell wall biosynthesis
MNQPLVSSIIIFFNGKDFLVEAIESVLTQTYENWELLLVDDASTDGSTEIAKQFVAQYPEKIRYLEHEEHQNRGMSATRNLGICNAKGKYVAFLDADDIWLPNKLQQQVSILESHPEVGMVYGRTLIWYSWAENLQDAQKDYFEDLGVMPNNVIHSPQLFPLLMTNKVQSPTTCNFMISKDLLQQLGGFEESFRGMYEDQVFYTKVYLATSIYVADNYWAKYRQHPKSCCAVAQTIDYHTGRLPLLTWIQKYLQSQKNTNTIVWKALRQELLYARYPAAYTLLNNLRSIKWSVQRKFKSLYQ